jgi:tetratricopeptide (TPR) repeat protein
VLRGRIAAIDERAAASLAPSPPPPAAALPAHEDDEDGPVTDEFEVDDFDIDIEIGAEEDEDIELEPAGSTPTPAAERAQAEAPGLDAVADNSLAGASLSSQTTQQVIEDLEEADFYMQQGLLDEAEEIYKRVLTVAPNHPRALVRLGEVHAARGGDAGEPAAAARPPVESAEVADAPDDSLEDWSDELADAVADAAAEPDEIEIEEEELPGVDLDVPDLEPAAVGPTPGVPDPDSEELAADTSPPAPAEPAPRPAVSRSAQAARSAAPAEPSFDLAAELSDAFEDPAGVSINGLSGAERDDGFAAVFDAFKKGVSEALSETDQDAHYDLGIAYKEMGLFEDATNEFRIAMTSPTRRLECLHLLGLCALDAGRPTVAIEHLAQLLELEDASDQQKLAARVDLGRAYEASGDVARARSAYEAVAAVDPEFCSAGELLEQLGEAPAAPEPAADAGGYESFDDLIEDAAAADEEAEPDSGENFEDLIAEVALEDEADDAAPEDPPPPAADPDPDPQPRPAQPARPAAGRKKKKKKISFV